MASVRACLGNYWQAPADEVSDRLRMADWLAALEDWPIVDVQDALRQWVLDNPDRRPNFGHISGLLKAARGKAWAERKAAEPECAPEDRVTPEAAAEIMRAAGYTPRRMAPAEDWA